jgi:HEPN domain-containing protein
MTRPTSDQIRAKRIAAFLQIAEKEGKSARHLLPIAPEHSAYFVQQSVEKLLRAVLEHEDQPAGSTHNIRMLAETLPKGHQLYGQFLAFDSLSSASSRYRYPTEFGDVRMIGENEVEDHLANLKLLQKAVTTYLSF